LALALLQFSGCDNVDVRERDIPESLNALQESTIGDLPSRGVDDVNMGHISNTEDMIVFEYGGDEMSMPYYIEGGNENTDTEIALLVFVDGVLQPFRIEHGDGTSSGIADMQYIPVTGVRKEFNIVFLPDGAKEGDKLGVYVCSILKPSFIPQTREAPSFGYYHYLAQVAPQQIVFHNDTADGEKRGTEEDSYKEIPESILEKLAAVGIAPDELDEYGTRVDLFAEKDDEVYITCGGNVLRMKLRMYGGENITRNVFVFINNKPMKIDGYDYIQSTVKKNKMNDLDISIELKDLADMNVIYAISVPTGTGYLNGGDVIKTTSKLLVK
jgi:hypothetical protein